MNKNDEGLTILDMRVQLNKREEKPRVILALYCYIVTKYFNVVKTSKSEMTGRIQYVVPKRERHNKYWTIGYVFGIY